MNNRSKFIIPYFFGLLSFSIGCCLLLAIWMTNPIYLQSTENNANPDAVEYGVLARNLVNHSKFSRGAISEPDPLRTPGYPLLLALLRADIHPLLTYLFQIAMLAGTAAIVVHMTYCIGRGIAASIAGILFTSEHTLHVLCMQTMSEITGLFLFFSGLLLLRWPSKRLLDNHLGMLIITGLFFGYATIARPSLLLTSMALILTGVISCWYRAVQSQFTRANVKKLAVFIAVTSILPASWIVRNYCVFGFAKLTPVSTHNLVYFVGAGALQYRNGIDRESAQTRIATEHGLPSYTIAQNPYGQKELSVFEIEQKLTSKQWEIALSDPPALIMAEMIGILKGSCSHASGDVSHMLGGEWKAPGLSRILRFQKSAIQTLVDNFRLSIFTFLSNIIHIIILYLGIVCAIACFIRDRRFERWRLEAIVLLISAYAGFAMFGIDAVYRSRFAVLPLLCMLSGYGYSAVVHKYYLSRATNC